MTWLLMSLVVTLTSYFKMFSGFFQQDEWYGYSEYILNSGTNLPSLMKYFFAPSVVHFTPLTLIFLNTFLRIFGMDYILSAGFSLSFHLIVLVLVYFLLLEIFESKKTAGVGSLLFASFAAGQQATSWVMADVATHGASIFGILSIIFFLRFLKSGNRGKFIISIVLLTISILFKEITFTLVPLMLYMVWFYGNQNRKQQVYTTKILVILGACYVLSRLAMIPFVKLQPGSMLAVQSLSPLKIIYNFITVPIKVICQSIIPIEIIRAFAEFIARIFPKEIAGEVGTTAFDLFVVKRVMEAISLLASIAIFVWVTIKHSRSKIINFGLAWIIINSLIFAFAPERSSVVFTIDSRYLYFTSIGAAIVIASVFAKINLRNKFSAGIILLIIIIPNLYFLNLNLKTNMDQGRVRKGILANITNRVPDLPDRTIFYTISNQSYYGLPPEEKILPFQSGFGQTLLSWYYPTENFPKEFFTERFLWEINSQGYKEVDNIGFGYFRDMDLLKETIKQYNLPRESLFAFTWDGKKFFISDMTDKVRQEIYDQKN